MKNNPSMYLIYIDESYCSKPRGAYVYSAIFINAFNWQRHFKDILQWREEWFEQHQIPLDYELHATRFVSGHGEFPANRNKEYRAKLFYEAIGRIEKMNGVEVMSAITSKKRRHLELFQYMLNRIERTLKAKNAYGIMICDEGNENKLTSTVRRMQKENRIASINKDVPLRHIIEDPLFKTSESSYFIQLADFLAFALLRNEIPVPNSTRELVQTAFEQLDSTLIKEASRTDYRKKGIVRLR